MVVCVLSVEAIKDLPGDDKDLVLHSHGPDGRGELLVGLVREEAEVLHLVCERHGRTRDLTVLGLDGDRLVNSTTGLGCWVVDGDGDCVLLHRVRLETWVGDGQRADRRW